MFSQFSTFHLIILQIVGSVEDVEPKNGLGTPRSCQETKRRKADITYGIDDIPPWYLCIFMALQVRWLRPFTSTFSFVRRLIHRYLKTLCNRSGYLAFIKNWNRSSSSFPLLSCEIRNIGQETVINATPFRHNIMGYILVSTSWNIINKNILKYVRILLSVKLTLSSFQHYLTMIGAIVSIPFILTPALCMKDDDPARSHIICTMIFVTGIVTWVQSTFGCRYWYS